MSHSTSDNSHTQEIWRDIPNTNGEYRVSSFGRVHDVVKDIYSLGGRSRGYLYCYIRSWGKSMGVHRLVALAFLGDCPEKHVVNHVDLNKRNNHLSNLEYVTHQRNAEHSAEHHGQRTRQAIQNKVENANLLAVQMRAEGYRYEDIARRLKMTTKEVREVIWKYRHLIPDPDEYSTINLHKPLNKYMFHDD